VERTQVDTRLIAACWCPNPYSHSWPYPICG